MKLNLFLLTIVVLAVVATVHAEEENGFSVQELTEELSAICDKECALRYPLTQESCHAECMEPDDD